MNTVVCKRCKDTRLECSGRPGYCIPCAQDLADYEAFDGEPAMLAGRWTTRYNAFLMKDEPVVTRAWDFLDDMEERRPITRYLSGAGSVGVEADPDAPSMFPDAIRGEQ